MGLANLVPGISGGTMLLAVGVYPQCIEAFSRLAILRPSRNGLALLAAVALSAGAILLLLAGAVRELVVDHRWAMYSVFLGSTLGGVPVVWRLLGGIDGRAVAGVVVGLGLMIATATSPADPSTAATSPPALLFMVGLGAFGAMLLPGLSGGYLLVLSGQYVPILGAIDNVTTAVLDQGGIDWPALVESLRVLVPFGAGGVVALVAVSTLVRLLLHRQRSLVLGFLLGLVAGAVLGLWPFTTAESRLVLPSPAQAAAALALAATGLAATLAIARLGATNDHP